MRTAKKLRRRPSPIVRLLLGLFCCGNVSPSYAFPQEEKPEAGNIVDQFSAPELARKILDDHETVAKAFEKLKAATVTAKITDKDAVWSPRHCVRAIFTYESDGTFPTSVFLTFKFNSRKQIDALRVGQTIKIRSRNLTVQKDAAYFRDCELLEAGPLPKNIPRELTRVRLSESEFARRKKLNTAAVEELKKIGLQADDTFTGVELTITDQCLTSEGSIKAEVFEIYKTILAPDIYASGVALSDHGLRQIGQLETVSMLVFSKCEFTDDGLEFIGNMPELTHLSIDSMPHISDAGLMHLSKTYSLRALVLMPFQEYQKDEQLDNLLKISDDGLKAIKDLKWLERLILDNCKNLSDDGLKHVRGLSSLKLLDLEGSKIKGPGLVHLAGLRELKEINLDETLVDGNGAALLAEAPAIELLWLRSTRVDDNAFPALAQLKTLRNLYLDSTLITEKSLPHLATMTFLNHLSIPGKSQISQEAFSKFADSLPESIVVSN
ncbi:MAG: hypothetical protein AAFN77_19910 [Planctomycetota bacterium]